MKVLHVVGVYPTPENPTRFTFVKTQVDSLAGAGVKCDVLVLSGRGIGKYLGGRGQVRQKLAEARYDLVHAHYSYSGFPALGCGVPVVLTIQGSDLLGSPNERGEYSAWTRWLHSTLSNWIAHRCSAVIPVSPNLRDALRCPARVIGYGVDMEKFHPLPETERNKVREQLGLRPDTRYVYFANNPARAVKRYPLAQAAVESLKGSASPPVELFCDFGKADDHVVRCMQACDALILTSTHEGAPNVIREAMACNLPVVSVGVGDVRERLEGVWPSRVAERDDPQAIGEALREVLESDAPCNGREKITGCSLQAVARQITDIYRQVIA